MTQILITGTSGFLGSRLTKHLISEFSVIGIYRSNALSLDHPNFRQYSTREVELEQIFESHEIDVVIHTATSYAVREEADLPKLIDSNLILPLRLLSLSSKYGVKLFINTDSFFSDFPDYEYLQEYILSKIQTKHWLSKYADNSSFKVVNVKLFHMYGENDKTSKFVNSIIQKLTVNEAQIELTDGSQTRDFIYVQDVVRAYETILKVFSSMPDFVEFELGSGTGTTIREFVTLAHSVLGSKSELLFDRLPQRVNEIETAVSDPSGLIELGWTANTSLSKGISIISNEFNSSDSYL